MYLDIFDSRVEEVEALKEHYRKGGWGDVTIKRRLIEVLNTFLEPIRIKRAFFEKDTAYVMDVIKQGTAKAQLRARETMDQVRTVMRLDYFK